MELEAALSNVMSLSPDSESVVVLPCQALRLRTPGRSYGSIMALVGATPRGCHWQCLCRPVTVPVTPNVTVKSVSL